MSIESVMPSNHLILCLPLLLLPSILPSIRSFQMSQLFASGGQGIGVSSSPSVLPMNTQDWSLRWTGWISLQSKGLSNHQFFGSAFFIVQISHLKESFPRQVDKKSRGPQGERGLEFSRRKKGQTFSLSLHSLGLYNNNVSCLRTVSGLNLLANSVS